RRSPDLPDPSGNPSPNPSGKGFGNPSSVACWGSLTCCFVVLGGKGWLSPPLWLGFGSEMGWWKGLGDPSWKGSGKGSGNPSGRVSGRVPVKIGRAHSELQSRENLVCRLLLEKKKIIK